MIPLSASPLKEQALTWIQECLDYPKALPRMVLEQVGLSEAPIFAVVPPHASYANVRAALGTRDGSTGVLYEYLSSFEEPDAVLVVVDELIERAGYADWQSFGTRILVYGDDVYHWALLSDFKSADELEDFFRLASAGWPLDGFLLRAQAAESWAPEHHLDESELHALVEAIRVLIIGAYDADGFLLMPLFQAG